VIAKRSKREGTNSSTGKGRRKIRSKRKNIETILVYLPD
jgi:hypothetical protein